MRDYNAPSNASGTTWSDAFGSIDQALLAASDTEEGDTIYVAAAAAGTAWKPGGSLQNGNWGVWQGGPNNPVPPVTSTFEVDPNGGPVRLLGGFHNDPVSFPNAWSPFVTHRTVLSGDLLGNDSMSAWSNDDATNDDNARRIILMRSGLVTNSAVDGFVIERGNWGDVYPPDENPYADRRGGSAIFLGGVPEARGEFEGVTTSFAQPAIQNCTIQYNAGAYGGAVLASRNFAYSDTTPGELPVVTIRTSIIRANRSNDGGGAIRVTNGKLDMAGTLVVANKSPGPLGGGILIDSISHPLGPFDYERSDAIITHCTIAQNSCSGDSGAGVVWDNLTADSEITFQSTMIVLNSAGGGTSTSVSQILARGLLAFDDAQFLSSAYPKQTATCETYALAGYDIEDPLFVDASLATPIEARDYSLHRCSPLRDLGQVSNLLQDVTDVDHDDVYFEDLPSFNGLAHGPRVIDSHPGNGVRSDIGAIENGPVCVGDLDGDGDVDSVDLGILLGEWTTWCAASPATPDQCVPLSENNGFDTRCHCNILRDVSDITCFCADLTHDRQIDAADLGLFLGAWGMCPAGLAGASGANQEQAAESELEEALVDGPTPSALAAAFGFESLDTFAAWLGELSPEVRAAILNELAGGSGGGE